MKVIVNDDINSIYRNYFNNSYNSITISSSIVMQGGKK